VTLYDVSPRLEPGMASWPGDAPLEIEWTASLAGGDGTNVARLSLSTHLGAHADAPLHLRDGAPDSAGQALEPFWGPARVVSLEGVHCIDEERLAHLLLAGVARLLLRTRHPGEPPRLDATTAHLTEGAARALVARGLALVGIDSLSVDAFESRGLPAHRVLLEAGVAILEGLELAHVPEGDYELAALPLRLVGGDASPVRAVLRSLP
jgi:arylformamidase